MRVIGSPGLKASTSAFAGARSSTVGKKAPSPAWPAAFTAATAAVISAASSGSSGCSAASAGKAVVDKSTAVDSSAARPQAAAVRPRRGGAWWSVISVPSR